MAPAPDDPPVTLRLRLVFDNAMLGPGKIDLLELIRDTGSISAAGRAMKMSYKRAWTLVEEMNAAYVAPLVTSARGGSGGGGAALTATGEDVVRHYRAVEATAQSAAAPHLTALTALLRQPQGDMSARKDGLPTPAGSGDMSGKT